MIRQIHTIGGIIMMAWIWINKMNVFGIFKNAALFYIYQVVVGIPFLDVYWSLFWIKSCNISMAYFWDYSLLKLGFSIYMIEQEGSIFSTNSYLWFLFYATDHEGNVSICIGLNVWIAGLAVHLSVLTKRPFVISFTIGIFISSEEWWSYNTLSKVL